MYSTCNEAKSVAAKILIKTLKNKIYKYDFNIKKCVYCKLDDTVNKYNNTYHITIKVKPVDVKPRAYIDSSKEIYHQDPKFKIGNIVRLWKYKIIFAKGYFQNWSEEIFVTKKVKNTVPWTYVISDLKGEEIVGTFYENKLKKQIKKMLELKK